MTAAPDPTPSAILAGWRETTEAATPEPWDLEWDSCDCGDIYGCSHGSWPHAIRNSRAHIERADGEQRAYDYDHTEVSELGAADAEFIVTARTAMPRLLKAVDDVLKPHQPGPVTIFGSLCKRHENHRYFSITATEADDVRACPDCEATAYASCSGCGHPVPVDSCPVRAAIGAALTGKEGTEDG